MYSFLLSIILLSYAIQRHLNIYLAFIIIFFSLRLQNHRSGLNNKNGETPNHHSVRDGK